LIKFKKVLRLLHLPADKESSERDLAHWCESEQELSRDKFAAFCFNRLGKSFEVVLKFMRNRDQWLREIKKRKEIDEQGVVPLVDHFCTTDSDHIKSQLAKLAEKDKTFEGICHFLVMPSADHNFFTAINSEELSAERCVIVNQIFMCMQRIHTGGVVHGDVKPRNFVRIDQRSFL